MSDRLTRCARTAPNHEPADGVSPEQIVAAATAGDADAAEALLSRVRDDVYGLSLRMLWDPDDAEDATQEILLKVLTRLDSYRGEAAVRTWVHRIAVNHLLDRRRSRLERQRLSFEAFAEDLATGLADPDPSLAPDTDLLAEEVKLGCTLAMLTCLDRNHRVAWILDEVFELSSDEAAWVCGVTPAAHRKRLSRGFQTPRSQRPADVRRTLHLRRRHPHRHRPWRTRVPLGPRGRAGALDPVRLPTVRCATRPGPSCLPPAHRRPGRRA